MTNKIDIVLKAITDRIAGALPSDTVKNLKLSTSPVLFARSYPNMDPQCSNHIQAKENEEEDKENPENIHVNPTTPPNPSVAFVIEKVLKFNSFFESLGLVPQSSDTEIVCKKGDGGEVMFIELIRKNDDSNEGEPEEEGSTTTEGVGAEYFDIFPTRSELAYHKYLMCGPIPSISLRNPIITEGCPSNLKIPCNIGHVHVERAYIDLNSPLNIMTRMMYNWIMRRKLDHKENTNKGVSNFTGRIKGMHVFVGNFTYVLDFMIVEDIISIIDPKLSQVVLDRPFVEISNMTHDPPEGVVRKTHLLEDKQIPSVGVFDEVEELVSKGHVYERMSSCTQLRGPLDLMSLHVSGSVPKKVQDFFEGLPYRDDSSDDELVGNSRTNFVYPWGNDAGPSVEE
ncbi:hypothetical protein Tco_1136598 [Tanacetum coccineum]